LKKSSLKNLSIREISSIIERSDEKRHRKDQLLNWLYKKCVYDFEEMTSISKAFRKELSESYYLSRLESAGVSRSDKDGSSKFVLECFDGLLIEAVLMEFEKHRTICISSQIGCSLGCVFCRTGKIGLKRNLGCDEILDQVIFFKKDYLPPRRRFNIVFMGMGEPFLNRENVYRAVEILNHEAAFGLGEKRVTVSTIGFPGLIDEAAASDLKFSLAVSLSATTDRVRKKLMPGAAGIRETLSASERFAVSKGTRTTLEYVLLEGINDSDQDAQRLSGMTAGKPFKINIIPFNTWKGCPLRRPSEKRIDRFVELLLPKAPAVTVRRSRGEDIGAACGQLGFGE